MKLYIAGPMTGLPEYNLPAFADAAERLRAAGHEPFNPGYRGVIDGYEWSDYLRDSLRMLLDCGGVALLDDWQGSRGARLEWHVARELDMPCRAVTDWIAGSQRASGVRNARTS